MAAGTQPSRSPPPPTWPVAGGAMGAAIRAYEWGATPLGLPDTWPQALRTAVELCLAWPEPAAVLWGPGQLLLPNTPFAQTRPGRPPAALGRPVTEGWPGDLPHVGAALAAVLADGESRTVTDPAAGTDEPTGANGPALTFSFTIAGLRDESGTVAGIFLRAVADRRHRAESDARAGEARQRFLLALADRLHGLSEPHTILSAASVALGRHLGLATAGFGLLQPDGATATAGAAYSDGRLPRLVEPGQVFRLADCGTAYGARLRAGVDLFFEDRAAGDRATGGATAAARAALGRAGAALSITRGGRTVAWLYAAHHEPRRWADDERALLREVAERAWAAVERVRRPNRQIWAAVDQARATMEHVRDVVARSQEARALRESEARFGQFATASSDVIWIRDAATLRFQYLSWAFREVYGADPREALGGDDLARWVALLHPEYRAGALAALERVRAGARVTHEFRVVRPADGAIRWVRDTDFPLLDDEGQVQRIGGIGRDITDERAAEAALRASEARYRLIVEGARDYAILTADDAGLITSWTPGAAAVFGWSADEAIGQPSAITFTPEDRAAGVPEGELETARAAGFAADVRWHRRKDGARVFIEGSTRALPDEGGHPGGFLKIGQDVTGRRATEERLRETLETLEQQVTARTADLRALSRRLLGVQEEVQRDLSRELHDQIGQLLTGLQLALVSPHPAPEALDRARDIAAELLRRVRSMTLDLRPPALDDLGLLAALSDHLGRYTALTGVRVDLRQEGLGRRLPAPVETAAYRLVQEALTNVARHAGAARATVQLMEGEGWLTVQVRDDGRGFDPAAADARTSAGLAGMRERVELLGGTFDIDATPGAGTIVTAELPVGDDVSPDA